MAALQFFTKERFFEYVSSKYNLPVPVIELFWKTRPDKITDMLDTDDIELNAVFLDTIFGKCKDCPDAEECLAKILNSINSSMDFPPELLN